MDSSFEPIEKMLANLSLRHDNYPVSVVLLTRLHMHIQTKLLENRNKMLKERGLNDTIFSALLTLDACENQSIQPSELSSALGSSRTNATRVADELQKRGWVERRESENDRRCLHLHLTDAGYEFLCEILPPQYENFQEIWGVLSQEEQQQLESIYRKLLNHLDTFPHSSTPDDQ
ncbi:transcriptional repressor MprA [Rosenbergiella australiborealis]|uniref:Transcriptional repressor MprA n=1 Tax=Rosenbergiella australiborealis TaxID=1544696 RepID=A0ABS5T8B0_9GAMM|nr:transcriptional repressor MprA [Rosenbergiella australiborealis]MBT0728367.1 transcriptional repressor MprA [Rosenbergiella australiborealis]